MSDIFWLAFGSGDPRPYANLSPTFLYFSPTSGALVTPPAINNVGSSLGMYWFQYAATTPIAFLVDGSASIVVSADRYIRGAVDPVQNVDRGVSILGVSLTPLYATLAVMGQTLGSMAPLIEGIGTTQVAQGGTLVAIGNSLFPMGVSLNALSASLMGLGASFGNLADLLGTTGSTFGGSAVDPTTVFGFLKRNLEFQEGNAEFDKSTGVWDIFSRGSSTLLRSKTLTNDPAEATKS